ncbi:Era-like GTP-binding protein [Salinigranum salinum]|uniref:GTPase n=1 Tax=Salinigranum salinum TaxID=1364937 RepID=UPI0012611173|nr:Era-like GTP-binding protein [Salinigranum salinum]
MGILARLKSALFPDPAQVPATIGLYGPPNAGKTTLANRIASDWADVTVGDASEVPHETQHAQRADGIEIEHDEGTVTVDVVDTPGVATEVDHAAFRDHGLSEADARERARGATQGIGDSIRVLREEVGGVIYVLDATRDPHEQVNGMLLGIAENQGLPLVLVANKIDHADADTEQVADAFPHYDVVPVSGLTGDNADALYAAIADRFG